ncbi:MAG: type IV secretion system DNA-binding domain-containing protein [Candidatus Wildermuthbacteria bacterium]|nr:type IV secretion system DNA-binding domain-containing protein [Candidatus Wildermuthbacteria bacterium]
MSDINFFGETNFRNIRKKFGIKLDDRRRHFYVVGKTGMGKTVMLENMAIQDIQAGHGTGFIDPHGEAAEDLLDFVPESRVKDVIYFNPADMEYPISFNVMEQVSEENRHVVVSGLMSVFKKLWPDVWSARMEYILNYSILALLETPDSTLLGINRLLSDPEYRKTVIDNVKDPVVKAFWVQEYARYTQRYEVEATAAIQNKVGQFISNPLIRNIIGQVRSSIDMREIMDGQKILIANLSKGKVGEDSSRLLGGLLVTKLQLAAMSRVDIPEEQRKDYFLYIDEFQNFATDSFTNILSEARKYRLALILGHQYISQLGVGDEAKVRDAVFGNVGTMVIFRVGAEDAEFLEKEFSPEFLIEDFVNLGKYNIYVKLMIDGVSSRPFSAFTLPPTLKPEASFKNQVIEYSRSKYGTSKQKVEESIAKWTGAENLATKSMPLTQPTGFPGQQTLYDAICSNCKKPTKVVFPPDGKRPVYCKSCRSKILKAREASSGVQAPRQAPAQPIPSQPARKEVDKGELQKVLREALQGKAPEQQKQEQVKEQGTLNPGETVYFNK